MSPANRSRVTPWVLAASAVALALAAAGFVLLRGLPGSAGSGPATVVRGGGLELRVAPRPGSPRSGANELRLALRDADGRPVDDATVEVRYSMSMPGVPEMSGRTEAEPVGSGEFRARIELPMAGTWRLALDAKRASGETLRAEGSLTTGTPGVRLEAAGGAGDARAAASAGHGPAGAIDRWTCPMHPSVSEAKPGRCPICGMELVPVAREGTAAGAVHIDAERRQRIGIRTAPVVRSPFTLAIRTVGLVTPDESALVDVSLKTRGWVRELFADALGVPVRRGDVLFTVYSPELYAAQTEYLSALRSRAATSEAAALLRTDALLRAARTRLRLWDVSDADVEALGRRGAPFDAIPVRSPASGFVLEKNVVLGGTIEPGVRLFRIAPLDRMWIDAQLYESDVDAVAVGQAATVSLPALPGRTLEGRVSFVSPTLGADTRTARARIVLDNPGLLLRPDMYANVELRLERGERVLVPASAVLYAGTRRVVFVDLGDGRLAPRDVELGRGNGEAFEVLSGLEPGEIVVTSGNFLVAAESRLQSALEAW